MSYVAVIRGQWWCDFRIWTLYHAHALEDGLDRFWDASDRVLEDDLLLAKIGGTIVVIVILAFLLF
jgi:hypothetical protein